VAVVQNEVESIRLRTFEYEMIIAQQGNFTIAVTQTPSKVDLSKVGVVTGGEEKKEGAEAEKKETA
jgi:hypothetical protein